MVKIVKDVMNSFKRLCNNDETCIFIVLILVGLLLCMIFNKDGFANVGGQDSGLHEAVDTGEKMYGFGKDAPHSADNTLYGTDFKGKQDAPLVGLVPKPNRADPVAPSMVTEMNTLGPVKVSEPTMQQAPGLLVQDGSITKPFDEVWNPGYEPVDMAFVGAKPPASQGGFEATEGSRPMGKAPGMEMGLPGNAKGYGGGEGVNLTLYYAPWCPHCKNMMPEWESLEKSHHGKSFMGKLLHLTKVDSDAEPEKVKAAGVQGFPEFQVDGAPFQPESRSKEGILKSLEEHIKSMV